MGTRHHPAFAAIGWRKPREEKKKAFWRETHSAELTAARVLQLKRDFQHLLFYFIIYAHPCTPFLDTTTPSSPGDITVQDVAADHKPKPCSICTGDCEY